MSTTRIFSIYTGLIITLPECSAPVVKSFTLLHKRATSRSWSLQSPHTAFIKHRQIFASLRKTPVKLSRPSRNQNSSTPVEQSASSEAKSNWCFVLSAHRPWKAAVTPPFLRNLIGRELKASLGVSGRVRLLSGSSSSKCSRLLLFDFYKSWRSSLSNGPGLV